MLGGYYLGQLYLGLSGQVYDGSITVQNTDNGHSADNITLVQHHTVVVSDTTHSLTAEGNLLLTQLLPLNQPAPGVFLATSTEIVLTQKHTLVIENTMHTPIDTLTRIINFADYNRFSGIYIVDRTTNVDTLVPATSDSGTLMTEFSAFGRYK